MHYPLYITFERVINPKPNSSPKPLMSPDIYSTVCPLMTKSYFLLDAGTDVFLCHCS